ncbi:MAG TPA: hypothetical protein VK206_25865 [Anaerolineales bacterium]|nr:hypothetical protein [Anaerolineales bacterium]
MKKVNWQQAERKSDERIKGGMSLWDRITNDSEFIKIKHAIQARYGLPLNYDIRLNNREWIRWIGYNEKPTSQQAKRGQTFLSDVHALFKKFEVPEGWYDDLIAEIAGQVIYGHSSEIWSSPKFEIYKDNEGNWKWRCIITPETDLTNPMYLEMIQSQQKQYAGNPPKPIKDKMNPRKLDWRPVYEWYKRHPLFTLEEIAEKIGYPAHRVRLKIAELETKE